MNINLKNRGFTLMDVLITTAIVSLLSSLFLFQMSEAKRKAEDSHMKAEAQQVSNAIALYKNDHNGRAPIVSSGGGQGSTGVMHSENDEDSDYRSTMQELVDLGYLSEIPTSPDGESYSYGVSDDFENGLFLFDFTSSQSSYSSSNSCDFLPPPGPPTPQICYMTEYVPAECSVIPEVTGEVCEQGIGCYTVVISEEVVTCTEEVPSEMICESDVDMDSSLCSDDENYCTCF